MKILSQSKKELYEFEGNNIFVVDDMIFISKVVNIYIGKPGILGQYKDTKECLEVLNDIKESYIDGCLTLEHMIYEMPAKKEEENENQQRESGNDNKV